MKKLNNKGFTLVELLAVIIILAIVVGITIPAIMSTTESAKEKALQTATQTSADWIERQYQLWTIYPSDPGINSALISTGGFVKGVNTGTKEFSLDPNDTQNAAAAKAAKEIIEAAGIKPANVTKMWVYVNQSTGRACVAIVGNGDYPKKCLAGGTCTGINLPTSLPADTDGSCVATTTNG